MFQAGNNATFGSLPGLSALLGNPTVLGGGSSSSSQNGIFAPLKLFGG